MMLGRERTWRLQWSSRAPVAGGSNCWLLWYCVLACLRFDGATERTDEWLCVCVQVRSPTSTDHDHNYQRQHNHRSPFYQSMARLRHIGTTRGDHHNHTTQQQRPHACFFVAGSKLRCVVGALKFSRTCAHEHGVFICCTASWWCWPLCWQHRSIASVLSVMFTYPWTRKAERRKI